MTTVTMNISLTDDLKAFVDSRIKARGYSSCSEYVRDLVRRDEERAKEERFKALIQEGLDSPLDGIPWEEVRAGWLNQIETARATPTQNPA
jgi:antitoxin ParD1/3/4